MALDYMAIVSMGAYPTPAPTTTQRAAYAVSYGLIALVATKEAVSKFGSMIFSMLMPVK